MTQRFQLAPGTVFSDTETRTIRGIAVPLNATAEKDGRTWRFMKNSVRFAVRTPVLMGHDINKPVGRLAQSSWGDDGLTVALAISDTPDGTSALRLAADQVLGLSMGIDVPENGAKFVGGEFRVTKAFASEMSLTALPAFEGSVITSVSLSQEGTVTVPDTDPEVTVPTVTVNLDPQALAAAFAAITNPPPPDPSSGPTPQPIPSGVQVTEPPTYTFDRKGNLRPGSHDFSTDLFAGSKGDVAAMQRAESFVKAQFDVDRADVPALNPVQNRPEMYVDQRQYQYPVWDAINKGTLADGTPFTFPKFATAAGLVAPHVEGVEPTPGSFTATNATVTPTANSGKVEITRETFDAGGNPQVSNLIWAKMQSAWYEALEASAVAVLDAATPTAIALTAGGGTTGQTLDSEITAAFAALQFIRGGFSMDTMFTQIDLYRHLVAAKDTAGRRLYPALGPVNALGTVASRFASLDVNGVTALPAWALAATGSVVASSYLFDSSCVHGWATAPQRLEFQYRVAYVDLAIWGYKATAISDLSGIREITYDPVP